MKYITWIILIAVVFANGIKAESPYVLILGTAQDAGVPQIGCATPFCKRAWKDKKLWRMVSSIALADPDTGKRWIFDATPDLPGQFQLLKEQTRDFSNRLDGVFLTHAHIGHYTGLMYFGRESMGARSMPVFAMPRMTAMLRENAPWSQLVELENILINPIADQVAIQITERIYVKPFIVPHRDEFSETVGYEIGFNGRSLIFIPDIDKWEKWDQKLGDVVKASDYLLVDGTFFSDGEIPRPISEVPHPFVSETMKELESLPLNERRKVHFIHFNHSNPLIQGNSRVLETIKKKGFNISYQGQIIRF